MENWEYRKMRGTDKPCTGKIYNKPIDLRKTIGRPMCYDYNVIQGGWVGKKRKTSR